MEIEHPMQKYSVFCNSLCCGLVQDLAQPKAKNGTFETIFNDQQGSSDVKNSCVAWKS